MPKSALSQLEEIAIRLDQSHKDGKVLMGTETTARICRLIVRAIKENKE